jgi:PTH1 family peptidyl-tRNA hydrolase
MIIFGLGNPGIRYRNTRHNIGYIFLDYWIKRYRKRFRTQRGYKIAMIKINQSVVRLIKPQCWMNESGTAIASILQEMKGRFLVVVDDINLPLGKIRLRRKGSDGGHLGLRSIINMLERTNFPRLRIGISRPNENTAVYVLNSFKRREKRILKNVIDEGITGLEILLKKGFAPAQQYINSIDLTVKSEILNLKH